MSRLLLLPVCLLFLSSCSALELHGSPVGKDCGLRLSMLPDVLRMHPYVRGGPDGAEIKEVPIISGVTLSLVNDSTRPASVELPFAPTLGSGVSGIEYRIINPGGIEYPLCAQIQTERVPGIVSLDPGRTIEEKVHIRNIRVAHCLMFGRYEMTAAFHNNVGNDICSGTIVSNTTSFYIPP